MSFLSTIADFLYSNTSSEYAENAALHQDVAAGQSARYNDLTAQGKIDPLSNWFYQREITTTGNYTADNRDVDSSPLKVLFAVRWYVWLALAVGLFWYFGGFGWLKRKLAAR